MFIITSTTLLNSTTGFNTSYVNVYRCCSNCIKFVMNVSIHPMLMFILNSPPVRLSLIYVSIHPMLMFICCPCHKTPRNQHVSIHPMLMFIKRYRCNYGICIHVSIHPMLMFIAWNNYYRATG